MPHCNDDDCTSTSRYEGADRLCACKCSVCRANVATSRAKEDGAACDGCGRRVRSTDEFCDGCGAAVSSETRQWAKRREREEEYDRSVEVGEAAKTVGNASRTIGGLAWLFGISAIALYVLRGNAAEKALRNLDGLAPDQIVTVEGVEYKVEVLRAKVAAEPTQLLILNLLLAGIMAGLWVWSKRSPLPAIATALAVFVGVHFVSFLLEPSTLFQGIVIKILAIGALASGLKAAMQARAARESG